MRPAITRRDSEAIGSNKRSNSEALRMSEDALTLAEHFLAKINSGTRRKRVWGICLLRTVVKYSDTSASLSPDAPIRGASSTLIGARPRFINEPTMSDFSLMDGIECGIVKLPRALIGDAGIIIVGFSGTTNGTPTNDANQTRTSIGER
jgi:hypothetical protein